MLVVGSQHRFASRTHIDKDELLGLSFVSLHRSSTVQGIKNTLVGQGVDWRALKVVMVSPLKSAVPLCLIFFASSMLRENLAGNISTRHRVSCTVASLNLHEAHRMEHLQHRDICCLATKDVIGLQSTLSKDTLPLRCCWHV